MSIARNFIAYVERWEETWVSEGMEINELAESFDFGVRHAVFDRRRQELGLWILERMNPIQRAVIENVGTDFDPNLPVMLHDVDYGRGTVALVVAHQENRA